MLDLSSLTTWNHPFPMGRMIGVFDPIIYEELVKSFPPITLAQRVGNEHHGLKYSIAPETEGKQFFQFLEHCKPWRDFYEYTVSQPFFDQLVARFNIQPGTYYTRFEFSFLPWDGGLVNPHRDAPPKVLAFVLPMIFNEHLEWGGHTEMLEPKGVLNGDVFPFDRFTSIMRCYFKPNSANFLMRTDNSWHGVRCHGPSGEFRKSITLNLMGEGYVAQAA